MLARSSGERERAVLGGEGEVERGQHGPLEVQVEDALGVLDGPLRAAWRSCWAQASAWSSTSSSGHDVVDQADLGGPLGAGCGRR